MTKAKTPSRPATEAAQLKTDASTAEAKAKRQRGKAAYASAGSTAASGTPSTDATPATTTKTPRQTKSALLRAKLTEPGGVSLAALIESTGWQTHTLRAYLSGLRKEGLTLTRRREGEDTIYAIDPNGTAAEKTVAEGAEKEAASEASPAATAQDGDAGTANPGAAPLAAETSA